MSICFICFVFPNRAKSVFTKVINIIDGIKLLTPDKKDNFKKAVAEMAYSMEKSVKEEKSNIDLNILQRYKNAYL